MFFTKIGTLLSSVYALCFYIILARIKQFSWGKLSWRSLKLGLIWNFKLQNFESTILLHFEIGWKWNLVLRNVVITLIGKADLPQFEVGVNMKYSIAKFRNHPIRESWFAAVWSRVNTKSLKAKFRNHPTRENWVAAVWRRMNTKSGIAKFRNHSTGEN
jgi:hypothetical protein